MVKLFPGIQHGWGNKYFSTKSGATAWETREKVQLTNNNWINEKQKFILFRSLSPTAFPNKSYAQKLDLWLIISSMVLPCAKIRVFLKRSWNLKCNKNCYKLEKLRLHKLQPSRTLQRILRCCAWNENYILSWRAKCTSPDRECRVIHIFEETCWIFSDRSDHNSWEWTENNLFQV